MTQENTRHNSEISQEWLGNEVYVDASLLLSSNSSVPIARSIGAFIGRLGFDADKDRYFLTDEDGEEVASIDYVYKIEDDPPPKGRRLFIDGWFVGEDSKQEWGRWIVEADVVLSQKEQSS